MLTDFPDLDLDDLRGETDTACQTLQISKEGSLFSQTSDAMCIELELYLFSFLNLISRAN